MGILVGRTNPVLYGEPSKATAKPQEEKKPEAEKKNEGDLFKEETAPVVETPADETASEEAPQEEKKPARKSSRSKKSK